jgi:dUTP pyrophosphatase
MTQNAAQSDTSPGSFRYAVDIQYLPHYRLNEWGALAYAKPGDSGFDLKAAIPAPVPLMPGQRMVIPTGIKVALPKHSWSDINIEMQIRSRSGLAAKHGITVLTGTIDNEYRGEILVVLYRTPEIDWSSGQPALKGDPFTINPGDRIAQAIIAACFNASFRPVIELVPTARGEGALGSTGV